MKRIGELPGPVLSEPSTHVVNGVAAVLAAPGRPTRHIDPEAGRWSSQLPLNFESCEVNLYRYVEPPQEHPDSAITPSLVQESETANCDEMVVCYDAEGHHVSRLPDAEIGESSEYRGRYV